MAAAPQRRCKLCPWRLDGNNPLAAQDPSVAKALNGVKARGKKHDESAANCVQGETFLSRCPRCSVCGKGDATTATAVRERGERLEDLKCRQCRANEGCAARSKQIAEARLVEDAKRAVTDDVHLQNRMLDEREDWHTVDETTGLSKYDQLVDAAEDFAALGTEFSSALQRNLAYARRVWPVLDGDALERKAVLVGAQISTILDLAQEKKLHTRSPYARMYLPELEKLATAPTDPSDSFHGAPRLLQYFMEPMIVETLSSTLVCYDQAERAAKDSSRRQASGTEGIYNQIFRWRSLGARGAPLFLLQTSLKECGLKPYEGPDIRLASKDGVRLGLVYSLQSTNFLLCGSCALDLQEAGCLFGKKKQASAVYGGEPKKEPGEASVLDRLITIPSRRQVNAMARAASCMTPGDGPRGALRVQKAPMRSPPVFDPSGALQGHGADAYFYFGGKTEAALRASFARCYEHDIQIWADGREGTSGEARLNMLLLEDGCRNAIVGHDFQLLINNDRGLYTPSGAYGGVQLSNGWVERIGCPLERDPFLIELCERANKVQLASITGGIYDERTAPDGVGGPRNYCERLPERERQAAWAERRRIQSFGGMMLGARRLYYRHAFPLVMAAIDDVDQGAVAAAIERDDRECVFALLAGVDTAIRDGIARVGAALDAGSAIDADWQAVANDAGAWLAVLCADRVASLPDESYAVPRAVALARIEELSMRDARLIGPGTRPVPEASGFGDAAAVGPPAPAAPAYGNSDNPRPRARQRRDEVDPTEEAKADPVALQLFYEIDLEDAATGYF